MKIEDPRQRTVEAIFAAVERNATDWRRSHLGASQIGKPCDRFLWYTFRWVQRPSFPGRMLALFERGQREEAVQFSRLRAAGVMVWSVDPVTGSQFTTDLGPHLGGSMDAVVLGLLEAPKTPHVLDVKTGSVKQFDKMLKLGAREWRPEYYVQLQLYMHDRTHDLDRAALLVVCKDDDRLHLERYNYDMEFAARQIERARRVVAATDPPERISEDPSWYACKFCSFHASCQAGDIETLERNCRTCVDSTPELDGTWSCDRHEKALTTEDQKVGCEDHLFHPRIVPRSWQNDLMEYFPVSRAIEYVDDAGVKHRDMGGEIA